MNQCLRYNIVRMWYENYCISLGVLWHWKPRYQMVTRNFAHSNAFAQMKKNTKHIKATQFMKLPGNNWIISPRIENINIFDNTGKHISNHNINKHQISRSLEKSCCIQDACKPTIVLFSSKPSARIWPQLGLHISPPAEMTQGDKSAGQNQNFLAGCFVEELDE